MDSTSSLRSVTYQNVNGYTKYPPLAKDSDGYRTFLKAIGVGHDYNSQDLRTVSSQELLSQLYPALSDPEQFFYLEFSAKGTRQLRTELQVIAMKYDEVAPRMSSSYIISIGDPNLNRSSSAPSEAVTRSSVFRGPTLADLTTWIRNTLDYIQKKFVSHDETGYPTTILNQRVPSIEQLSTKLNESVDKLKTVYISRDQAQSIHADLFEQLIQSFPIFDQLYLGIMNPELEALQDGQFVTVRLQKFLIQDVLDYAQAITPKPGMTEAQTKVAEIEGYVDYWKADAVRLVNNLRQAGLPDDYYTNTTRPDTGWSGHNTTEQVLTGVTAAMDWYLTELMKKQTLTTALASELPVIIRFYPAAAVVAEPLCGVSTVPLSEHSFLQVATPQNNIAVQFMGCAALDTPDTQWRQLYAEIFKTIMRYGNPKCSVCAGRYIVKDCHLASVPDLSNAFNTAGTFNFGLISENWDSGKNDVVNYIG